MATRNIPAAEAGPSAADVMLRDPRTVAPETTVATARGEFENPRVRLLLVARDGGYLGAVTRESIPADADADAPIGAFADRGDLVAPGDPVQRVTELLDARGTDRLPVVDGGAIVGLVCFNSRHGHFCVDA